MNRIVIDGRLTPQLSTDTILRVPHLVYSSLSVFNHKKLLSIPFINPFGLSAWFGI